MAKKHVVLAGNPGVGKSFILNALVGSVQFKSGVSIGEGMTTVLQPYETQEYIYSDTPGLDDLERREKAASEISSALKGGENIKLIFVCTLESGRIRPADLATIRVVLKAIEDVGVDTSYHYSVLINKCSAAQMSECAKPRGREKVRLAYSKYKSVTHIDFFPKYEVADDVSNHLLTDASAFVAFVDEAPTLPLPPGANVRVDARQFDEIQEQYERELEELKKKLQAIESERDDLRWARRYLEMEREERQRLERELQRAEYAQSMNYSPSVSSSESSSDEERQRPEQEQPAVSERGSIESSIGRTFNTLTLGIPGFMVKAVRSFRRLVAD